MTPARVLAVIGVALFATAARIHAAPADAPATPADAPAAPADAPAAPADGPDAADRAVRHHSPPPEPPVLVAWKIGQWATYRLTDKTGESTVTLRIVAEDSCGFWIVLEIADGTHLGTSRACVTRTHVLGSAETLQQVEVIATRVDGEPTKITNKDETSSDRIGIQALRELLTTEWSGRKGVPRDDVTTPAGTFITLKETHGSRTRWSHPEVPISGVVRELEGGVDFVLLDYGQTSGRSMILEDQERLLADAVEARLRARPHRFWFGIAFGNDLLGNLDDGTWTASLGATVGWRLTRRIGILIDSTSMESTTYPPDPDQYESLHQVVAGIRWFPYDRPATVNRRVVFDASGVYLQADLGYASLDRGMVAMPSSTVGRGGLAGVRLGVVVGQSPEWKLGVELHEHTALLNGDEGLRITFGLHATIELYMR